MKRESYKRADVTRWIKIARRYLRNDGKIPIPMLEIIRDIVIEDPRLGIEFFQRIRRYPSLKKNLMRFYSGDDEESAYDEPPAFLDHPGASRRSQKAGQVHPEIMFR